MSIVQAEPWHAAELAARMRPADVAEVLASGYASPREALEVSLEASAEAWALRFDGELAALFGVVPAPNSALGARMGCAWLLTGRAVERREKAFLRTTRVVLAALRKRWDLLVNLVDARYAAALRWVRWAGFALGPAVPYGPRGLPFVPICLGGA